VADGAFKKIYHRAVQRGAKVCRATFNELSDIR